MVSASLDMIGQGSPVGDQQRKGAVKVKEKDTDLGTLANRDPVLGEGSTGDSIGHGLVD